MRPAAPATTPPAQKVMTRAEALAAHAARHLQHAQLLGSISLKGARIDDVRLAKHRETIDPKSPPVPVLSPVGVEHPYYAEFGWSSSDPAVKLPGPDTLWTASSTTLAPGKPVRLTWDNGQGLIFALDISLDEHFMFDVKQSVENKTDKPVTLFPGASSCASASPRPKGPTCCMKARTACSTAA